MKQFDVPDFDVVALRVQDIILTSLPEDDTDIG